MPTYKAANFKTKPDFLCRKDQKMAISLNPTHQNGVRLGSKHFFGA
jgi:hypothetical protein